MKAYWVYQCDSCEFTSRDPLEVERHEAAHLGLTLEQKREYEKRKREVRNLSGRVERTNNDTWRREYDKAVTGLLDFERKYGWDKGETDEEHLQE